MRSDDWPFERTGPWDVDAVRQWAQDRTAQAGHDSEQRRGSIDGLTPLQKARLVKIRRETEKLERQIAQLDQLYVEKAVARAEISSIIHNTRSVLMAEPKAIADALDANGLLVDHARDEVEREIHRRLTALCHTFAGSMNDVVD